MVKKIALGLLIAAAVASLLLVAQIRAVTWLYDNKMDSVLNRLERKIPGLRLDYESKGGSFTERHGRISVTLPLKQGNRLGESFVSTAFDVRLLVGPLKVSGNFTSVPEAGNLSEILSRFKVDPLVVRGAFNVRALTPKVEAAVRTDSFLLPTATGICKFGQNALHFAATSEEDLDLQLASAGVICEGAEKYNNRPNYRLDLLGLNINFLPKIVNRKPHFDRLEISLDRLDFKFSTLYALGFAPDDRVKDPTLQEALLFENVSTLVSMTSPDGEGMAGLSFDNSGSYAFAFPYVKDNEEQPYYRFDDFRLKGELRRVSFAALMDTIRGVMRNADEKFDSNLIIKNMAEAFSDEIEFNLEEFGYTHEGRDIRLSGNSVIVPDLSGRRPKLSRFDSRYELDADAALLEELIGDTYKDALQSAIAAGQLARDGTRLKTEFVLHDKTASMNGVELENLFRSEDDRLYEEEQKALQRERELVRKEKAELEAEIRAAREAQSNLPSAAESQERQIREEEMSPDQSAEADASD